MNKLSQIQIGPDGGFTGFGPLGLEDSDPGLAPSIFTTFISNAIGIITLIAIIWFVFTLLTGAISFITSGGDKTAVEGARKKIVYGLIGLVVTIAGVFLIRFVGYLLGFPDILNFLYLFGILSGAQVN